MIEDGKIVDMYIARDEKAITCSSAKYGNKLRYLAEKICGDELTAQECENDTYLRAWNSIPPHEPRTYLFSFLAKITRFAAIDCCKRENRQRRNAEFVALTEEVENCIPGNDDAFAKLEEASLSHLISNFLRGIPENRRNVFIRRYWYMDSVTDIAERYSYTEGKVKTILFRVRNELRVYLEKEGVRV